jgi:hypothetical protein
MQFSLARVEFPHVSARWFICFKRYNACSTGTAYVDQGIAGLF